MLSHTAAGRRQLSTYRASREPLPGFSWTLSHVSVFFAGCDLCPFTAVNHSGSDDSFSVSPSSKSSKTVVLRVRALSRFSCVPVTPGTVACQAPLLMAFSRQEYWSGLPCPPPGDLPTQGSNLSLLCLLHWQVGSSHQGSPRVVLGTPLPNRDRTETARVMGEGNDRGEEGDGERGLDFSEPSRSSSRSRMTQFCLWD